jgi:hypothetical protein
LENPAEQDSAGEGGFRKQKDGISSLASQVGSEIKRSQRWLQTHSLLTREVGLPPELSAHRTAWWRCRGQESQQRVGGEHLMARMPSWREQDSWRRAEVQSQLFLISSKGRVRAKAANGASGLGTALNLSFCLNDKNNNTCPL